ncbi:centrosomal protein kizuna-like isoform X1 [Salvelinus alpinus]|uniref:centrosomal protein kizuna-like isoform X1 n=3 Tax=Salvelinus alpinus TaxID=8036 RepID=UPI0039FBE68D
MAFCEDQYYERIGSIQQSMHEREKRRLELERELFAYYRSDKRGSQIKCATLCGYLKEICEREKQAKIRNLELLRDVECIEMSMKEHCLDRNPLDKHKVECLNRISRFMAARQKKEEPNLKIDKGDLLNCHPQGESPSPQARALRQPSVIFMGRQTSRSYATEDATTSIHLRQAERHSPNHLSHASECLQSGLLNDSKVSREVVADSGASLSVDISGSKDSPDGCNLCDKHERTAAVVPSVRTLTASAGVPFGGDEQLTSPRVTLTRPEKNSPSPDTISHMWDRNSPAEYTRGRGSGHQESIKEDVERVLQRSPPQTDLGKESQDVPEKSETLSRSSSSMELSVTSSGSDLSISLTESDLAELPKVPEGVVHVASHTRSTASHTRRTDSPPQRSAIPPSERELRSASVHSQSLDTPEPRNRPESRSESTSPEIPLKRLSMEGFFHLLESIEERFHRGERSVYCVSSLGDSKRNKVISLCNARAGLNGEDLDACGAVVLHQLQRLSWTMSMGCLLPEELVSSNWSTTEARKISSRLPPDAAPLWDRWFKHALLLKDHHVLTPERLVQLFTPLLLPYNASYSAKAKVLLRTLLSRSSEECPSVESESSSCGLPSFLNDSVAEVQPARPSQEHRASGMQGLQSGEEDSQDESPVESIPIKETKAYQLLKQSATQARQQSSGDEEDLSGINDGHEENTVRVERSSHQDPYPWRETTKMKTYSAVQSKAFWGESDDSNSEIEAALRPQYNTNNDNSEDF